MWEASVDSRQEHRQRLSLAPEEKRYVGGEEREAQGILGGTLSRFVSCETEGELYAS